MANDRAHLQMTLLRYQSLVPEAKHGSASLETIVNAREYAGRNRDREKNLPNAECYGAMFTISETSLSGIRSDERGVCCGLFTKCGRHSTSWPKSSVTPLGKIANSYLQGEGTRPVYVFGAALLFRVVFPNVVSAPKNRKKSVPQETEK